MKETNNLIDFSNEIFSMSNRRKIQTGLPVNIWIDENGSYRAGGHGKRIKFQLNYGNKSLDQPEASMGLSGDWENDAAFNNTYDKTKSEIKTKDIQKVANFVKNNSYALDKVADQELYLDQFDQIFIKGGELASQSEIDNLKRKVDEFVAENNSETNNVLNME